MHKIEIHSIKSIETRSMLPFEPNTILISMGDTGAEPPKLQHKPDYILRLIFDDITLQEIREEFKLPESLVSSDEDLINFLKAYDTNIFSDKQAQDIAEFVFKHNHSDSVLICQCHYGQSRSAGCAAAISEYFYGNGIDFFADDSYYPNKLVFRKVLKALEEYESAQ